MQLSRKFYDRPLQSSAEAQWNIVSERWLETTLRWFSDNLSYNVALSTKASTTVTFYIQNVTNKT